MTDKSLLSCRVKLDRAEKHLGDLDATIRDFNLQGNEPHEILTDDQPDGLTRIYRLSVIKDTPELSGIVGDCIHNLRSALDSLAVTMLKPEFRTEEFIKNRYFPIQEWKGPLAGRNADFLSRISDEAANLIVHTVQPYDGGAGSALCVLNNLSRIDRHRSILAVNTVFNQAAMIGAQAARGSYIAADRSALKNGDEIGRWICRERPNDYPSAQFNFTVLLNEGKGPPEPIMNALMQCKAATKRAFEILAPTVY